MFEVEIFEGEAANDGWMLGEWREARGSVPWTLIPRNNAAALALTIRIVMSCVPAVIDTNFDGLIHWNVFLGHGCAMKVSG